MLLFQFLSAQMPHDLLLIVRLITFQLMLILQHVVLAVILNLPDLDISMKFLPINFRLSNQISNLLLNPQLEIA